MTIRILHVVDTLLGMGGMEKVVVNLIQRMDPARFEHVLCVVRSLGILADYVPRDRARVVCLGRNASRFSFQAGRAADAFSMRFRSQRPPLRRGPQFPACGRT